MSDILGGILAEAIIQSLNHIGAAIKWIFVRNKYSYKELLNQNWNNRIGLLFVVLIFIILYNIIVPLDQ